MEKSFNHLCYLTESTFRSPSAFCIQHDNYLLETELFLALLVFFHLALLTWWSSYGKDKHGCRQQRHDNWGTVVDGEFVFRIL